MAGARYVSLYCGPVYDKAVSRPRSSHTLPAHCPGKRRATAPAGTSGGGQMEAALLRVDDTSKWNVRAAPAISFCATASQPRTISN